MDTLTKRALRHINLKMVKGQLDVPRISLQLLSSVGKLDFPTERLRVQWQKRQASTFDYLYLQYASVLLLSLIVLSRQMFLKNYFYSQHPLSMI